MDVLVDVNVLLAVADSDHLHHSAAGKWFSSHETDSKFLICRVIQMGLFRLLVNKSVMNDRVLTLPEAWTWYGRFIQDPSVSEVAEPKGLQGKWAGLCFDFGSSPKVLTDAYLAAFAMAGGFSLASFDKGFSQFQGLEFDLLRKK
jgi:toxin-antitoxin system PIN domain toxin